MLPCKLCGQNGIEAVTEVATTTVRCGSCHRDQHVRDYFTDVERLQRAVGQAMANRGALAERRASGVQCPACGGTLPLPADLQVSSFACPYCRHQLLVSEYVAPQLLAAERLRGGLDAIYADGKAARRRVTIIIVVTTCLILGAVFLAIIIYGVSAR